MNPRLNNPPQVTKLLNQRFGMLEVVEILPWEFKSGTKKYYVSCKCDCGSSSIVETNYLRSGDKKHCGCIPQDRSKVREASKKRDRISMLSKGYKPKFT